MKITKHRFAVVLFNVLFLLHSLTFGASEEQVGGSWINGKWEGRPPIGGELTMTLTVDKDNQVQGTGFIRQGGNRPARPDVTGTVNGKSVSMETFFPGAFPQGRVHYDCILIAGDLQCRTQSGYKTTFKKVD